MKARNVVILLMVNAAALAAGWLYFSQAAALRAQETAAAARAEIEAWRTAAAEEKARASTVVYRTNAFRWSQIETTDYREYVKNLRAIGCPESTIKDIILTDVMRLYAQRRGAYYQNGREFKYWETDEKRHLKQAQLEEREKALAAIDKELPAVLRELLGINYDREVNKYFVDADEENRRLSFLPEAKRDDALALREKFEGAREKALLTHADAATLRQIDADRETAFGDLLTVDEKEQYDLAMSPTADRLRSELVGFNPTEDEFKALFARQKAIDDAYADQDPNDESVRAQKAADEKAALAAFQTGLTPDRSAQLTQAEDPEFQNLTVLTERFDLPADTSGTLLAMRSAAEDEKRQLLADHNIPADRLDAALKAIQMETEKAARQALGEQAYAQYAQTSSWIKKLGSN